MARSSCAIGSTPREAGRSSDTESRLAIGEATRCICGRPGFPHATGLLWPRFLYLAGRPSARLLDLGSVMRRSQGRIELFAQLIIESASQKYPDFFRLNY